MALTNFENILDDEKLDQLINPIIYTRGVSTNLFTFIISGKIMVCSGNEGFYIELGNFNYMGSECLTNDNYIPDFSAKVIGNAKLLQISREDYRQAISHIKNNF